MKYHYRKGVQVGWSSKRCTDVIATLGWLLLLLAFIDMMLFNGQLLTNLLTL